MIAVRGKGKRYSPRFQFQVVLEVLKGDREATEIARAYNIDPVAVSRWKQEFLEKGSEVLGEGYNGGTIRKKDQGARAATGKERSGDDQRELSFPFPQGMSY